MEKILIKTKIKTQHPYLNLNKFPPSKGEYDGGMARLAAM
jgi:hypothetical protein